MNRSQIIFLIFLITFSGCNTQINILKDIVQFNIVGIPLVHKKVNYEVDPDIGLKRRKQFEELNGHKGEKLIERLGLGTDGKYEERLRNQRIRDEGHLGGVNDYLP